ncbi:MAG: LPS assembly lipoprotein LptE [Gammaproteobacteria bacterium]
MMTKPEWKRGNRAAGALRRLWFAAAVTALAGCGFHLRGAVPLPAVMHKTYVDGDSTTTLVRELKLGLRGGGVQVVREPIQATAILRIIEARQTSRVLSVDATGQVREYELSFAVRYVLTGAHGAQLAAPQRVVVVRNYTFDPNNPLAKANEKELLRKEMERDAARGILRRLRYVEAK